MESSRSFSTATDHTRERFEFAAVGGYGLMVFRSLRRHPVLFLSVWMGVVALTVAGLAVLPRTYDVQTTLQVARGRLSTVVSKTAERELDAPTRLAAETVQGHENLVTLVRQTNLLERWPLHRAPLLRLKDAVWARLFRAPTTEERVEGFVGLLEKRIWVDATPDLVNIGIHFPDSELAFDLVERALGNFLEARRTAEISSIEEAITILEARSAEAHQAVETALADMSKARIDRASRLGLRSRPVVSSALDKPVDKAGAQLITQVQARRQQLAAMEDARRRRMLELQTQLEEKRAVYAAGHPEVARLQGDLDAMGREPGELLALRADLGELEREIRQRGLLADVPLGSKRIRSLSTAAELEPIDPREDEDAAITYTKAQVRHALIRYNGLLDRIDAAQLELDNAQAAFKRRYVVIRPPQRPAGPVKPRATLVLLASVVAGAVLGLLAPALVDLLSRRLVEPWQVEQALGLPLLGEVRER